MSDSQFTFVFSCVVSTLIGIVAHVWGFHRGWTARGRLEAEIAEKERRLRELLKLERIDEDPWHHPYKTTDDFEG